MDLISLEDPKSPYAEAYRTVRTSLLFSSPKDPPRTIVVTSPGPREGKTANAVNLAVTMAAAGKKVLLVDADMRKPRVHKVFGFENTTGLADILGGMNDIGKTLRKSPCPGLTVMTSGRVPANPSELLGADRMHQFLEAVGKSFDRIVLDTTPLIAVTDATLAGLAADGVILVVNAGAAGKRILRRCIDQLQSVSVNVIGTVLNSMDARRGSSYYSSYHYAYYRKYYGEDNGRGSGGKAGGKKKAAGKKRSSPRA